MKKICLLFFAVALCLSSHGQYVDLGLPSGTKWAKKNEEGFYKCDDAVKKFGCKLPTNAQWQELNKVCSWKWKKNGYEVIGPNGNSIFLPFAGYRNYDGKVLKVGYSGYYWSFSFSSIDSTGYYISLSSENNLCHLYITKIPKINEFSVHLVQDSSAQYVDLGLRSGTKWMDKGVAGFYEYDKAVKKFGNNMPTKNQWDELKYACKWKWKKNGYEVIGPNGNSIFLPVSSPHRIYSQFWSYTPDDSARAWVFGFRKGEGAYIYNSLRKGDELVRLVQNYSDKYVDLGLPSGTMWMDKNKEGFYSYDEAIKFFGNELPTYEQYIELLNSCKWTWNGKGYKVTGPNGNSIVLPAAGECSCDGGERSGVGDDGFYWSSTLYDSDSSWCLDFLSFDRDMFEYGRCLRFSVRLVQEIPAQYVDLGLPSGTMWMNKNEDGFYNFDDAVELFGDKLPTKEQLEELKGQCEWTWTASGYKVTGPNGNSIFLPAAGEEFDWEEGFGECWSSTPFDSEDVWTLYFDKEVQILEDDRAFGHSVRLVQKQSQKK